jgi:AraC-like DNA-binding protein
MKLVFYYPKDKTLKKYIQGYYFMSEDKKADSFRYYTFPNNYTILSVGQNTKVEFEGNKIIVSPTLEKNVIADLVCSYSKPIEVIYEQPVNEITIYFKPLGILHFLNNLEIFKQQVIESFDPFTDFKSEMESVFDEQKRNSQIEQLENYWLSKFKKRNFYLIEEIVSDIEENMKVQEIAEKYNLTRQYVNKLFLKFTGKPASEYRRIHRFRNAVSKHKKSKNLTLLSYDSFFFDQSHFIKDFKKLTDINPISFFKAIDTENENIWLIF